MKATKLLVLLSILIFVFTTCPQAQSLEKRHQIELRMGMWNQVNDVRTEIGIGSVSTTAGMGGFMGGLSYGHWLQENVALNFSIEGLLIGIETDIDAFDIFSTVSTSNASVTSILMGMKYYFLKSSYNSSVKPFLKAGVGPFIGTQLKTEVGLVIATEMRSQMAFGGNLAVGVDFLLGRHFMIGVTTSYNLMSNFREPIGGSKNYSGPEFGFGFSYLFGKGVK